MNFALMIFALMILAPANASADDVGNKNRKANRLYNQGKYEEALKLYDEALLLDPADSRLKMNRGSALYRLGNYDEAEKAYEDALTAQNNKKAQADAHYNLGNILYKQGERLESEGNASSARSKYSQALENYINTLKLRPGDRDAKWNLQLAHQKIDTLEGQPDQNQDGDEDDEGDQEQQKDGKGDKNQENSDDQNKDGDKGDNDEQDQGGQPQEQNERDMKKEEAERLIEQYADDADTLNRPQFQRGRVRQPEKDW
ncbi:MAG: tetratricopeptide repeat protein [Chitinispirillia bacterium]|nr:tetratricopeptide repeat protein [Chitinispirillia bacterium]MCL2269603.1 tetratricopeptide repeat protein [Chitinispirillia bacterium]